MGVLCDIYILCFVGVMDPAEISESGKRNRRGRNKHVFHMHTWRD